MITRILFIALCATTTAFAAKAPIQIIEPKRTDAVDFDREVRPFLSDNCLSCHCQTTTKGGLNMETPELMLKGGETGPSIVPQKATESLLLQAAAHMDDDLSMPPRDNKAKAKNLTPEQLGLLKLWIDQGAKASPKKDRVVDWQPLSEAFGAIFATAVTADGQYAACARANRIAIYHLPTGKLVLNEPAHRDQVNALAFNPDGSLLASGSYREVKLWRRGAIEGQKTPAAPPTSEAPIHTKVEGALLVVTNAEGKETARLNHGEAITAWARRPDGQRFATIGGSVAKLWGADGKMIAELRGDRYLREAIDERERGLLVQTSSVTYRKEGVAAAEKALLGAQDRVKKTAEAIAPKEQDVATKQKALADAKAASATATQALATAEAELKKDNDALQAAITKAGAATTAALDAIKGTAAVDANKVAADAAAALQQAGKLRVQRDQHEAQRKQAADKIEPANKQLATAEEAAKNALASKAAAETERQLAKEEEQKATEAIPKAKTEVDAADAERKKSEEAVQAAKTTATAAEKPLRAAIFSPDGSTVVTAGDDQLVHTWSAESGAACEVLKGHAAPVTALAFAADGKLVSSTGDGAALSWDLAPRWKLERTIGTDGPGSPLTDRVNALAFSRDGKQLATGSGEPSRGGEIKVWDLASGKLVHEYPKIHSDAVFSLEFSPDGKQLASGAADKMARIVDLSTGKLARSFEGHTHHVLGVSWSADGRTLASAGADGVVKIWDVTTGDRKKNIEGYEKEVTAVRFVGATTNLLTSSGDNKVRLVGIDGREVRSFPEAACFMESAAASADGKLVVAGGEDGILRVWNGVDGAKLAVFAPEKK